MGRGRPRWAGIAVSCAVLVAGFAAPTARADTPPTAYWTSPEGIGLLNGSGANPDFINTGSDHLGLGLASDGEHIYAADQTGGIKVYNLDGTLDTTLAANQIDAAAVAVNDQYVYWSNLGESGGSIGRMRLDGSDFEPNFITFATPTYPDGIAVSGSYIYWANTGYDLFGVDPAPSTPAIGSIGRANLDGTNVNALYELGDVFQPSGLAVDNTSIYWADTQAPNEPSSGSPYLTSIAAANLDGTGARSIVSLYNTEPWSVAVDPERVFWGDSSGELGDYYLDGIQTDHNLLPSMSGNVLGTTVAVPHMQLSIVPGFQNTLVGSSSQGETLTVENRGQAPLTITNTTATGADPQDFTVAPNGCGSPIPAGGYCQMTVTFTPQGSGARSATLNLFSTDYANSPASLSVSGSGVPPASLTTTTPTTSTTPSTSTTTPTPTPKVVVAPKIAAIDAVGSSVKVALSCPAGRTCARETVTETVTETFHNGKLVAIAATARTHASRVRTTHRQITIAAGALTVRAGHPRTLTLTLNATGRRLLSREKRLRVEVTVRDAGRLAKRTTVRLTEPKPPRRR